jgi:FixJ family two-component response regulator
VSLDDHVTFLMDETGCVTGILSGNDLLSEPRLLDRIRRRVCEVVAEAPSEALDTDLRRADLSPRERQVMDRLVSGRPVKAIARELGISPKTVEFHRGNVLRKMAAESVVDLGVKVLGSRT